LREYDAMTNNIRLMTSASAKTRKIQRNRDATIFEILKETVGLLQNCAIHAHSHSRSNVLGMQVFDCVQI